MLGLKLNHASKRSPWKTGDVWTFPAKYTELFRQYRDCQGGMIFSDGASTNYFVKLIFNNSHIPSTSTIMHTLDGRYYRIRQIGTTLLTIYKGSSTREVNVKKLDDLVIKVVVTHQCTHEHTRTKLHTCVLINVSVISSIYMYAWPQLLSWYPEAVSTTRL